MNPTKFIKRIIKQRPLCFFGRSDSTLLVEGYQVSGSKWKKVGIEENDGDLKLSEYMDYKEIQVSALVGVSSPTYFINDGGRNNMGRSSNEDCYPMEGVYTGLVGARFERKGKMESNHILVQKKI